MKFIKAAIVQTCFFSSFLFGTPALAQNTSAEAHHHAADPATTTTTALPGNSIYQLNTTFADQDGQFFRLADKRGKPMLVSMFYNSCEFVCPMLIDSMRTVERNLSSAENDALSMMLITFDPARDNTEVLQTVAKQHHLDSKHWTVARTEAASVRKIAAALGIQYRQLDSGEFNHTTVILLLDTDGKIIGRSSKIGEADPEFIGLVKKTLQASGVR